MVAKKVTIAQLQQIVENQEIIIQKLKEDADAKDIIIKSLCWGKNAESAHGQVSAYVFLQRQRSHYG